jgi:sugar phosphate isomerase/epimerase
MKVSEMKFFRGYEPIPDTHRVGGFALGCQAYSFNRFSAFEAIEKTAQAGGKVIEFYPGQKFSVEKPDQRLGERLPDDLIAELKAKLEKHGVRAVAFGVTNLGKNVENNRRIFEFVKKVGIGTITCEPDASAFDVIEPLVKEFDVRLAIHNHPRTNNANYRYWDPKYVLSVVDKLDRRIGACADTGHWARSGIKPVDGLKTLRGRILSLHLKDLTAFEPGGRDTIFGTGTSDLAAQLTELRNQKFDGVVSIEYESNWDNNVPDIAQCFGFVRGWAARR